MADTCAHCGPLKFIGGQPVVNLSCPDHGLRALSERIVEENCLANAVYGACKQHPHAPVTAGVCRSCANDTIHDTFIKPFAGTVEGPISPENIPTFEKLTELLSSIPSVDRAPVHPDTERRVRYGAALRDQIKALTVPAAIPGGRPTMGASEYEIADAALVLADAESAQLLAERNAALRIAEVWDDAPDPACRAMAADLRSAINGARAARRLDCGWCYEENGEEVHPHPECPIGRTATEATDNGAIIPAALTPPTHEEKSRPAARCGDTTTGMFGSTLGPCINDPGHENTYHRDARGAEWSYHGITKYSAELSKLVARAIHRYDYDHDLAGNDIPGEHHRGEAAAVLTALEEFLDIGEAEAWCRSCRRVWDSRHHRCESDAEQQLSALHDEHAQLGSRVEHLMRTLHAIRRFNQLTADGSRVQAAENARDNLDLLDTNLPVPVHLAAGSARAEFLNLCSQWGLTTGRGSRELVARILQHHAHEVAEDLRAWARNGDSGAEEYGSSTNVLDGADRIDPYSPHYIGAQHS